MKISPAAIVETDDVGEGVSIGDFAVVRAGARLGDGVVIHPHVVIEAGVVIGSGTEIFPGAYLGREPKGAGATARQPEFEKTVTIGAGCSIGANAVIYYEVSVGDSTLIGDGASVREKCAVGSGCVIGMHVTVDYAVGISDGVKVMDNTHVVGKSLLEEGVFIAPNVGMANDPFMGSQGFRDEFIRGITLRRGAMVGVGANLLSGVEVGEEAVVAAGSLVDRDVPARKMAFGVPAKHYGKLPDRLIEKFSSAKSGARGDGGR